MKTVKTEFNGEENNPLNRYELLVDKQTRWLGYLISLGGIFAVLITVLMGIYSYVRIESIETKIEAKMTKYESQINELSKDMNNEFMSKSTYIETKQEKYEDKSNSNMNSAIKDMEVKFDKLSGQALIYPEVSILYNGENLDGKTIKLKIDKESWENKYIRIDLKNISIKNTGGKKLEGFNVVFTFNTPIECLVSYEGVQSDTKDNFTTVNFNYGNQMVNPQYNWVPSYDHFSSFILKEQKTMINCSMDVYFYPSPKKINFKIELIPPSK
jgi:hypothetical protein